MRPPQRADDKVEQNRLRARRFGGRGLAVVALAGAILGPPRDYWYIRHFPEWGSYGPGLAPVFAISATYFVMLFVGQGIMRLVAGPAEEDPLERRLWATKTVSK